MKVNITWGAILLLCVGITYVAWGYLKPAPVIATTTSATSNTTATTHAVTVAKPDGTTTTTVDTITHGTTTANTSSTTTAVTAAPKTKYSGAVRAVYKLEDLRPKPNEYQIDIGRRIGQTNLWIEMGTRTGSREVSVGVRGEI